MKSIFSLIVLLFCSTLFAQNNPNRVLHLELLGNSKHLSINYDSRFSKKQNGLGYQAGIGGTINHYSSSPTISVPIGLNYTVGGKTHKALIGAVAIPEFFPKLKQAKNVFFRSNINVGYRYESNSGVVLNAIWMPQIYSNREIRNRTPALLWFGADVGIKI